MKLKNVLFAPLFAAILFASPWVQAQTGRDFSHDHMWGGGWGWGGMILGPLFMIVFLAVLVGVIVLVVRWLGGAAPAAQVRGPRTALDILDDRFARGEIDKDEYEDRRLTLSS